MVKIKYERYWNDFIRKSEEKTFYGLDELANWIFDQMQQDYTKDFVMSFPTPEKLRRIRETDGPYRIEFKPTRGGESIWIYLIQDSNGIIFSDGRFTSGKKHWSRAVQEWCIACDKRQHAPTFNFVDEQPAEPVEKWFAATRWSADDVISAADEQGVKLTEEQAVKWWEKNEKLMEDALTQCGNDILASTNFKEAAGQL